MQFASYELNHEAHKGLEGYVFFAHCLPFVVKKTEATNGVR